MSKPLLITVCINGEAVTMTVGEARLLYQQLDNLLYRKMGEADKIKRAVAEYYNVSIAALEGKRKHKTLIRARWVAWALCKDTMSFPEIADSFSHHHSSVIYGLGKLVNTLPVDPTIAKDLIALRTKLKEMP